MRDYVLMRQIMALAADRGNAGDASVFFSLGDGASVESELERLSSDGLLSVEIARDCFGACVGCEVGGLTDEGVALFRLVENPDVWRIVHSTLEAAKVDISYPLLKEVCEEIVKRYVTGFIPDIRPNR